MHKVTIKVDFESMHRIPGHKGKCKYLHGHSYVALITLSSPVLDDLGMVVDFGVVKNKVKGWIDKNWDHNAVLSKEDDMLKLGRLMKQQKIWKSEFSQFDDKPPYVMECNPTAENMAKELADIVQEFIEVGEFDEDDSDKLQVEQVIIQEGPGGYATYIPEPGGGKGDGEGIDPEDGEEDEDGEDDEDVDTDDEDEKHEKEVASKEMGKKKPPRGRPRDI